MKLDNKCNLPVDKPFLYGVLKEITEGSFENL